jgi:hypothetical protein
MKPRRRSWKSANRISPATDATRRRGVFARGLEAMIQAEIDLQPMLWLSEDHKEGKLAFFEKRTPQFKGR